LSIQWVCPQVNGKSRDRVAIVKVDCFGIVQMSLQFGNGAHTVMWGCTCVMETSPRRSDPMNFQTRWVRISIITTLFLQRHRVTEHAVRNVKTVQIAILISRSFSGLSSPFLRSASIELWAHSLATGPFGPQLRSAMFCRTASARSTI
jgi:hypothetical protein